MPPRRRNPEAKTQTPAILKEGAHKSDAEDSPKFNVRGGDAHEHVSSHSSDLGVEEETSNWWYSIIVKIH
jgi:hypothetical protein